MKIFVPDYYNEFSCHAGDCKHNCCIGWEVDIDAETLEYYNTVEGDFGKRLKGSISYNEETAYFSMDDCGRCPFLNENGLCDIMMNLGFDKVSQICDDHPRFRNFYSDRTEIGLGMSCEAVAKLILSHKDRFRLICTEGDDELLWSEEEDFLAMRDDIFSILQNRERPVKDRVKEMVVYCGLEHRHYTPQQQAHLFMSLERLDEERDKILAVLGQAKKDELIFPSENYETAFEQLAVYFAFRHLTESLDDGRLAGRVQFIAWALAVIYNLCALHYGSIGQLTTDDIAEICRMFSAEIEYSTDNMDLLFDVLA